ncbi:MAG: YncE family protein [Calditrichia bacterium]
MERELTSGYFQLTIPLNRNQRNDLILYAVDEYDRISDSTFQTIIHDNIPPKIDSTSLPPDGRSYRINTPIIVNFDSPVTHKYSRIVRDGIGGSVSTIMSSDFRSIEFVYPFFSVGDYFPLNFTVTDSALNMTDTTITINTYFERLSFPDGISKPLLDSNQRYLYVQEQNTKTLYKYDLLTLEFEQSFQLSLSGELAWNPQNKRIYIYNYNESKILVFDTELGIEIREFSLLETDTPDRSADDPLSLAFTLNGTGIATAKPIGSSGPFSVQVIVGSDEDSLYIHPKFAPETHDNFFARPFNYDKNLFLSGDNSPVEVYDYVTDTFTTYSAPTGVWHAAIGNRKADRFMIYGNTGVTLMSSQGTILANMQLRTRHFDFSYRPNEDNSAYYLDVFLHEIGVINFDESIKTDQTATQINPKSLMVTLDGRFIILSRYNEVLLVEPKTFRAN